MEYTRNRKRGFTLVELLVVILIITMLATLLVPNVIKKFGKAKKGLARAGMAQIEMALTDFYTDCGRLPTQSEGLDALVNEPPALAEKWASSYIKPKLLIDPWGNPYDYRLPGTINADSYDLISYGADGTQGGEGENEDIYNE